MSPFLSDLVTILEREVTINPDLDFDFDLEEPFKPFNQLVFILPKASFDLLPPVYGETIFAEDSQVNNFYPEEFEFQPFDGIKDYMWIADIEVIDEKRLQKALEKVDESKLTDEDKYRNRRGHDITYKYNKGGKPILVKSAIPGLADFEAPITKTFFDIREDGAFDHNKMNMSTDGHDNRCGYPSLFFAKNLKAALRKVSRRANYDRVILEIKPEVDAKSKQKVQIQPHRDVVYYGYPFML